MAWSTNSTSDGLKIVIQETIGRCDAKTPGIQSPPENGDGT